MTDPGAAGVDPGVMAAVELALNGEGERAREALEELWVALRPEDAFHRCVVAHYLADLQADAYLELWWDKQALAAALANDGAFDDRIPGLTLAAFLPSLHLNLAASHERTSDMAAASEQARLALESSDALQDSPLGEMTRAAIERLCRKLGVVTGSRRE